MIKVVMLLSWLHFPFLLCSMRDVHFGVKSVSSSIPFAVPFPGGYEELLDEVGMLDFNNIVCSFYIHSSVQIVLHSAYMWRIVWIYCFFIYNPFLMWRRKHLTHRTYGYKWCKFGSSC
ncbi:uncharacterized protein LOC111890110 isoform X1 [Lactuca sativa]|uniref:uncharacterized protein LOC111890110 isoform X1 n=1 Tax=Lactuca sativa TaxID=4236 RepID=UPI000CD9938A|nr:uncharacterized protein LOC111890110 isoform X1 [Lactuca sativa]